MQALHVICNVSVSSLLISAILDTHWGEMPGMPPLLATPLRCWDVFWEYIGYRTSFGSSVLLIMGGRGSSSDSSSNNEFVWSSSRDEQCVGEPPVSSGWRQSSMTTTRASHSRVDTELNIVSPEAISPCLIVKQTQPCSNYIQVDSFLCNLHIFACSRRWKENEWHCLVRWIMTAVCQYWKS